MDKEEGKVIDFNNEGLRRKINEVSDFLKSPEGKGYIYLLEQRVLVDADPENPFFLMLTEKIERRKTNIIDFNEGKRRINRRVEL
jgi:hypothetical protein